jgi:hypothetical protein
MSSDMATILEFVAWGLTIVGAFVVTVGLCKLAWYLGYLVALTLRPSEHDCCVGMELPCQNHKAKPPSASDLGYHSYSNSIESGGCSREQNARRAADHIGPIGG